MKKKLYILACEHFQKEFEAAAESEENYDITIKTYPARCGNPPISQKELHNLTLDCDKHSSFHIYGSCCISSIEKEKNVDFEEFHIYRADYCFSIIAGRSLINHYLAQKAYILTPGWLKNWRAQINKQGFDRKTARKFYREFAVKLVLFDTGVYPNSSEHIKEFAAFLDLPFEIVFLGLDFIRLSLSKNLLEWRLDVEKKPSDYAMAMEFINSLTRTKTEEETINKIIEIFTMLFAPKNIFFLPAEKKNAIPLFFGSSPEFVG